MHIQRVVAAIVSGTIIFGVITGCENKKNQNGKDNEFGERIKISTSVSNSDFVVGEYYKYLSDKFNIDFEFIPFTNGASDKLRIAIVSGDMPDITDASSLKMNEFRTYAKQGSFKELPDLSPYPNLENYKNIIDGFENFKVNGKLYAMPRDSDGKSTDYLAPCQYVYRVDWAKKVGIYNENNEYTWDEFTSMAQAFKEKDPGGNGSGKTIPIAVESWAFPMTLGIVQNSLYWECYYKKDGKYVWGPEQSETLDGLKLVKDLYDKGLIWKDQVLARYGEGQAKFEIGETGITLNGYSVPGLNMLESNFKQSNPDLKIEDSIAPMYVKSPVDGKLWAPQDVAYSGYMVVNPNVDDKKFERILKFWDWTASEDGYNYSALGIEGKDWKMQDGKKTILWPKDENGNYKWPYDEDMREQIDQIRWTNSFILDNPRFSKWSRTTFKNMIDRYKQPDTNIKRPDYDLIGFSAPTYDKYGTYQKEVEDKMKELIVSAKDSSDLEKQYKEFIKTMNSKIKPILEEINSGIKNK